jgi:hypothetical protein
MQMIPDQSKDLHRVYYQKNNLTYGPIIGGQVKRGGAQSGSTLPIIDIKNRFVREKISV